MMHSSAFAILIQTASAWGLSLTDHHIEQFAIYASELQRWNERVNLTAITDLEAIVVRHFLDSLRCALSWDQEPALLADIGSGAGFPGLPLKLLYPTLQLTLIESVAKKTAFLEHIVRILGLDEVTILTDRVEQAGHDVQHRERYNVVTMRAVADMRVLAEYGLPLLRIGGRLLAPKGADVAAEVAAAQPAISLLGGIVQSIEPVALPGVEPKTLVVVEKRAPTPPSYPRIVGVPTRRPL